MSRFANTAPRAKAPRIPDTVNMDGAPAYSQEAKLELASILATSFVVDGFYRDASGTMARVGQLLDEVDPLFAAKAAVYARNTDGMRSITHVTAAELARRVKGQSWTKRFFDKVVRRPDDATEILAYYLANYGKPLPNSLKKGLAQALGKFDPYQLAKYRGEGKAISLVDVVNLTHPKPTDRNGDALAKLVGGTLRNEKTWEAQLTQAGAAENVTEAKADVWRGQLESGSIGQLALLRNLRNIAEQAPELVSRACELLTDQVRVERALIFPFQYLIAYKNNTVPAYMAALSEALDCSIAIVPDLGETLIATDGSGSMSNPVAGGGVQMYEVGALFSAVYFKKNHSDVGIFENDFELVRGLNPADSTLTLTKQIMNRRQGYATNFEAIFSRAKKGYDSFVIFSDMQANLGYGHTGLASYRRRTGANPNVFAFDLAGYGSSQFDPRAKTFQLAGFSDKSFGLLGKLATDPNAFVAAIEAVEI